MTDQPLHFLLTSVFNLAFVYAGTFLFLYQVIRYMHNSSDQSYGPTTNLFKRIMRAIIEGFKFAFHHIFRSLIKTSLVIVILIIIGMQIGIDSSKTIEILNQSWWMIWLPFLLLQFAYFPYRSGKTYVDSYFGSDEHHEDRFTQEKIDNVHSDVRKLLANKQELKDMADSELLLTYQGLLYRYTDMNQHLQNEGGSLLHYYPKLLKNDADVRVRVLHDFELALKPASNSPSWQPKYFDHETLEYMYHNKYFISELLFLSPDSENEMNESITWLRSFFVTHSLGMEKLRTFNLSQELQTHLRGVKNEYS
tara:strand:- start:9672 stop:10595 length:924 start_codon:yes stop_codon:yes gene_type:complete